MNHTSLKKVWLLLMPLLMLLTFASCNRQQKYRIGVSQCSSDDWRSKMNDEIMREAMFHDEIDVEILSADDSNEKQIADLDYFMENDFDIIIVAPNEAKALTPKIKEIYESGKPIIVFDRNVNGDYYTAYQGADNKEIGVMAAAYAMTLKSSPKVIEIRGLEGSSPAEMRHAGFIHGADSLGIDIVADAVGNWNYDEAFRAADSLLKLHPEVNLIFAQNDRMAIGACDAASALGRHDIAIMGIDAAPSIGIKAVNEGKIDATFLYPTEGYQLVRTALAILEGEPYERVNILPTATPVDATNAGILLLQNKALKDETDKIGVLTRRLDAYTERYDSQTTTLYVTMIIMILFIVVIFLLLKWYWSGKRHRRQIEKRNEELARQRDELDALYHQLQEATGSKLTFFTNVSHDLRTPLTLIADPVARLADATNLNAEQHTLMQLANKNVKRLQRLINQILDIRKYDNGQLKLNLTNVNLTESLREWVAPFSSVAAKNHIRFSTDIPQHNDVLIALDIEKTERILFNLLSNAFKFTPENGVITVSLTTDNDNVIIKVSDTGTGIPENEIKHIFERFFKTDRINPNGSGIGLALSKVFIDMHGGSINVNSVYGTGSVFTVTLPLRTVDAGEASPAEHQSVVDVSEIEEIDDENIEVTDDAPTVLVIDDNPDICTLVKTVLSDKYTVLTAHSGKQGIRLATRYVPDLIICDVMMPGVSGYEVCRALKKEVITSHIPVLLLTACNRDEQRIEGYDCGADAYMAKPFESPMLIARCKSLIDNRQLVYNRNNASTGITIRETSAPSKPKPVELNGQSIDDEFLNRFISLIEDNIADAELTVETLADKLGLSRVQMYRKVKALTNYSAAEMIRNTRLRHAATMLKTSSISVSEVAYAVGFSSPSYFSRCYKEYYNESPAETQARTSKAK